MLSINSSKCIKTYLYKFEDIIKYWNIRNTAMSFMVGLKTTTWLKLIHFFLKSFKVLTLFQISVQNIAFKPIFLRVTKNNMEVFSQKLKVIYWHIDSN